MPEEKLVHLVVTEKQKENFDEMMEFWSWIKGSGKAIQWLAIFGLPVAAAIWGMTIWIKQHYK